MLRPLLKAFDQFAARTVALAKQVKVLVKLLPRLDIDLVRT